MRLGSRFDIRSCVGATVLALLASAGFARADVPLDGYFVADAGCVAFQSLRKQSNPVPLEESHAYKILAANKETPSHFMIVVPGAAPDRRWAPVGCGTRMIPVGPGPIGPVGGGASGGGSGGGGGGGGGSPGEDRTQYVLAASWQPGFCETKPGKPECQSQTEDRFDASHFALHGLWPQPRSLSYCHVGPADVSSDKAGRWDQLPPVTLEAATDDELKKVMPGTQSNLERHEWIKHGTCYAESMEDYFTHALAVMRGLNDSGVQRLFAGHIGQFLSFEDIQEAFDESFGAGTGDRVRMQCIRDGGRLVISELTIGLTGEITPEASLSDLIAAASPTKTECPGGIVDPAGLQ